MINEYNYGDAYKRHPIEEGIAEFPDGSKLKTHDIFNFLPAFMKQADLLFTDSPWNKTNYGTFYTKAGIMPSKDFDEFVERLFECIRIINPKVCYLEIGKEYLSKYMRNLEKIYPYVSLYNSTYYHNKNNICYVIRGSYKAKKPKFDYMDEEDIINAICEYEDFNCIADLCMGQGLVALAAYQTGHRFVGTELNHKRLSVTIERLSNLGAIYSIKNKKDTQFKEIRENLHLTQSQVAKAIGIHIRNYQEYEAGVRNIGKMNFASAMKLCQLFDINPDDLLD